MKKRGALAAIVLSSALGLSLVACVPDLQEDQSANEAQDAVASTGKSFTAEDGLAGVYDAMNRNAEAYAPKVVTFEDGTQAQRTPDGVEGYIFGGAIHQYNTQYLDADNRGCISCHEDGLNDILVNHLDFGHFSLENGLGTEIDVRDCRMCHDEHTGFMYGVPKSLGDMIHGIHGKDTFTGDCMSCHTANADGEGMQLWEDSKYDVMSGITPVENVQGDFSYRQDVKGGNFGLTWWPGEEDNAIWNEVLKGTTPDESTFDNWEISVSGLVDHPFSITLKELIEQAPSETFIGKAHCVNNQPTGELIGNYEVTGVPISWLLEKAGVQEGAVAFNSNGADGSGLGGANLSDLATEGAWLIYEIEGRPLTYYEGGPVRVFNPSHAIPNSGRFTTELVLVDEPFVYTEGFGFDSGWTGSEKYPDATDADKPNMAFCNIHEGQIIPVGQPFTFEGYADGFDEQVTAIEFSMDRGQTWTRFDTSDSDKTKWVWWNFDWTPEEVGAYVLQIRTFTDKGTMSPFVDEVMVNVK